jgi:hypothetical protein
LALGTCPLLFAALLVFSQLADVKIDPATAHDYYSAWREDDHDDLLH